MSKFGLMEPDETEDLLPQRSLSERLAGFSPTPRRHVIDIAQVDAAAAPHGFVSREPTAAKVEPESKARGRRRRAVPSEPARHLALRLSTSQYDRFVAYADRYQLTYQDALVQLMDEVSRSTSVEGRVQA